MAIKRKTRMYEPWGYQEENNYQGSETIFDNDLESFFADVKYIDGDKKIHFYNKDGEENATLDVTQFAPSVVESAVYDKTTKILTITFSNGDKVEINLADLIDENEFADGLVVDNGIVKVLIDSAGEPYLSVSTNGIKISGVDQAIADAVEAEKNRAESAETALQATIDAEAQRAQDAETALDNKIDQEIADRKADVDEEEARAKAAEEALQEAIDAETARATSAETDLQAAIASEESRAISAETDLQAAIELKADKETTYTKEEVDALIAEKEAEITQIKKDYNNLKEIVGEIGGNVEWGVPADGTFNNMMKKSGTVKLGEDTTTSTYTGGITSANKTTLNLNGKNLTFSGTTTNNPAIMTRGKQELTIMGKGTFDADGRIAIEANGADTVINLSGTTGFFASEPTYVTDRSGGELIYCYLGTINIYAGVFKNNGADKTFLLNCYDANYSAGTAKIVVYGGKFYDFDPSNAMSEPGAPISYLAEGYHVETSTDGDSTVYTVKKDS